MAKGAFLKCHGVTSVHEGGWSDHAADPGGATMYGITIGKYREHFPNATKADLRRISKQTALNIYEKDYWRPVDGETLHAGVDLAVYDAAVNSGVGRAKGWLKTAVGGSADQTVRNICKKRLGFVQSLKIWKTFGKGWARRIADIEAKGVAWALAAVSTGGVVKKTLERESVEAKKTANQQTTTGAGGGAVGTGGILASDPDQIAAISLVVFLVVVAAVAGVLIWRGHINKQRAAAYAAEAAKL